MTAGNFAARLEQADLLSKIDFDNKLINFNKWITSNKTKHLEDQKKLNNLITKDCIFSQNFVWVYIIMLIICLLMEKISLKLKLTIKILTFQPNFGSEVYLMALVQLSLEKYL